MSGEVIYCPSCGSVMKRYDKCTRTYFDAQKDEKRKIKIPRYKCTNKECKHKYHRILPQELLLPYARYTVGVIQNEIDNILEKTPEEYPTLEAEEGTIRNWIKRFKHFAPYMNAAVMRCNLIRNEIHTQKIEIIYGCRELSIFRSQYLDNWLSKIASQTIEILMCGFHSVCNDCP